MTEQAPPTPPAVDESIVDTAVEIARAAGELTLRWFRNDELAVDHKDDGTPVTEADLAAETLMRARLNETFPDDAVIGEEFQDSAGTSGRTWVIDPIDGTKAFTKGVPLYSNLLALIDEHGPAVGVINLPALGETVWAGRGLGAFHNGRRCRVSDHSTLDGAYIMSSGFNYWPDDALQSLLASPVVFRTWGDAYGYALVATGRAEAMIDPLANPWDVAPMAVIIPEAGGHYTTFAGDGGIDAWKTGSGVGTNGAIHDALLNVWA